MLERARLSLVESLLVVELRLIEAAMIVRAYPLSVV